MIAVADMITANGGRAMKWLKAICLAGALLACPQPAWAAVAIVGTPGLKLDGGTNAVRTLAGHTLDSAATFIIVRVHSRETPNLDAASAVTWAGANMSPVGAVTVDSDSQRVRMFYLASPTTGSENLVVSFSASVSFTVISITGFSGVDTAGTPLTSFQTGTGTSAASPATITDVISAVGDMVISALSLDNDVDLTAQNQTADYEDDEAFNALRGAGGHADGASSVNPEWTYSGVASWAMQSVNVVASAGGDPPASPRRLMLMGVGDGFVNEGQQ